MSSAFEHVHVRHVQNGSFKTFRNTRVNSIGINQVLSFIDTITVNTLLLKISNKYTDHVKTYRRFKDGGLEIWASL